MNIHNQHAKEYLSGNIERITYHNPENGFCVLQVKVKNNKDLVTVTGNVPAVSVGEYIKCSGIWYNSRNYGLQFKADFLKAIPPNTLEGMKKYLGSGLIKGIGPHFAEKLVSAFKEQVFTIIENNPELLSTIDGIGKIRAQSICNNWQDQKTVREIMVFLQSHGVGTTRATRIYKTYGEQAIDIISRNPYKLAKDIKGIGFISADMIASSLGIAKDSVIRARAGIAHVLLEVTSEGHCGLPKDILIRNAAKLLDIDQNIINTALSAELAAQTLVADKLGNTETIFLAGYYGYEKNIAKMLLNLSRTQVSWSINSQDQLNVIAEQHNISLADSQKLAIACSLTNKVTIITGGPGTGKTTIVNVLLKILKIKELNIKLCAPTGRAARRLSESTGCAASTVHRLLEIDHTSGGFKRNEGCPLMCDYLVIDETSMIDVSLFYSLLKAIPSHAGLLLVGDVDQLPSVGAGQVLKDIMQAKVIPTVQLTKVFRQAATSQIVTNAHLINKGTIPNLQPNKQESDFYFIKAEQGEDIINKIISLITDRIPQKFKFNAIDDIQVLCPMQRGGVGARSLNIELQKALNPRYLEGVAKFGQIFAVGDKVMQIENNYDKETYNGDVGIIKAINKQDHEVVINFYNREVSYDYTDLDQITLAYAITIHKSQGSEYPVVIMPITMQSYMMLRRNLMYTAITRGKKLVIVIGQKKAVCMAISNNTDSNRYTKLKEWLLS